LLNSGGAGGARYPHLRPTAVTGVRTGSSTAQWQEGAGAGDSSLKAAGRKMPGTVPGTEYPGG